MEQRAPEFSAPLSDTARLELAAACGLAEDDLLPGFLAQKVSTGFGHLNLAVRDPATVVRAVPNAQALIPLLRAAGTDGVYVFAMDADGPGGAAAKARLFAPVAGILEDPGTGSAAGPLGAYVLRYGLSSSTRLTISQGKEIGRPSTLITDVKRDDPEDPSTWRVYVSGGVATVGQGVFDLPD
jgi:PhzF family phenazine biosynthesis protein